MDGRADGNQKKSLPLLEHLLPIEWHLLCVTQVSWKVMQPTTATTLVDAALRHFTFATWYKHCEYKNIFVASLSIHAIRMLYFAETFVRTHKYCNFFLSLVDNPLTIRWHLLYVTQVSQMVMQPTGATTLADEVLRHFTFANWLAQKKWI